MTHKHLTGRGYLVTWIALLLLTSASLAGSYVHLGTTADIVWSLVVACAKTTLVVMFFMHLIERRAASRLAAIVSVLLTLILITLAAADVATRHH